MGPEGNIWVNFPITTFQQSLTHSAMHCNGKMMTKTAGQSIVSSQSESEEVCDKLQEANCHPLEDDDDDENHEDKKDEDENYEKAVYQNFASSTSDTQTIWQN